MVAWSDRCPPGRARCRHQDPRGVDVELMFTEGAARCWSGVASPTRAKAPPVPPRCSRRSRPPATPAARPGPPGGARVARGDRASSTTTRSELLTVSLPGVRRPESVRCSAAGTSSSRARRARPSTPRPGGHRVAPSPPPPAAGRGRGDGFRRDLPAADPPDRRGQPQGAQQRAVLPRRPGPDDGPARPGRSGSRTAGTTRSTDLGTFGDFDAFVARPGPRARGRARPALRCGPDHPWVTSHPEWFTPRRRDDRHARRTRPRSTRTSTRSTSTTIPGHLPGRCCASSGCGCPTACGSSGSTTRTKPVAFWEWLLRRSGGPTPTCSSLAEAFTKPGR